jgi:hypothetical protein
MTDIQKTDFLEKLGYNIETIHYRVSHDGGRSSEDWTTEHFITIAYKELSKDIEDFKSKDFHYREVYDWDEIGKMKFDSVFKKEFDNHLFNLVMDSI